MPDAKTTRPFRPQAHAGTHVAAAIFLFVAPLVLTGCVVRDIRDDLAATRAGVERLAELAPALRQTNASLERSNTQMETLYTELTNTHKSLDLVLARLDDTNAHLQESTRHLRHLDPMMASLKNLDESLAALRKIVENIDKAVPLLNLTAGTPPVDRTPKPTTIESPGK